jgi:hypothetical protein
LKKQENKSVQEIHPIYEAQFLTYLKLSERRLGFLVNWNVARIKDGIQRMVNRLSFSSPTFFALLASSRRISRQISSAGNAPGSTSVIGLEQNQRIDKPILLILFFRGALPRASVMTHRNMGV